MNVSPQLSVIVPTYNRRTVLAQCLSTVLAADFPSSGFEVVVVVDGSTDGSADYLRRLAPPCSLLIVEQHNRGLAAARNAGAKAAAGDLILFLDDDIRCPPKLLASHVQAHQRADTALVVCGPLLPDPYSCDGLAADWMARSCYEHLAMMSRNGGRLQRYQAWVGPNFSMPRSLFLAQGGYDEALRGALEDADFGFRLCDAGVNFHFEPSAVAYHIYAKSTRDMVRRDARRYGANSVLLCRKHPHYRARSPLAQLGAGPWRKTWSRQALARCPFAAEVPLSAWCWSAERLRHLVRLRCLGTQALQWRSSVMHLRGALEEAGSWAALRREFGVTLPVLRYVPIGRSSAYGEAAMAQQQLERDLRWLAQKGYTGIRPSQWLTWLREGKALPDNPVLLAFSQEAFTSFEDALAAVQRYGFGAVVLLATRRPGSIPRQDSMASMSFKQIRLWARRGIEFGVAGHTQQELAALNFADLVDEVSDSQRELTAIVGEQVLVFAYPHGVYDERIQAAVSQTFSLALTYTKGLNNLANDPFMMKSSAVVYGQSLIELWCQARWGYNPLRRERDHRSGRPARLSRG